MIDFQTLPLIALIGVFAVSAVMIIFASFKLSKVADMPGVPIRCALHHHQPLFELPATAVPGVSPPSFH